MARNFTSTSEYLSATSGIPTVNETQGTLCLWICPPWAYDDGQAHQLFIMSKAGPYTFEFIKWSDNALYAGWYPGSESRIAFSAATLIQNDWNLLAVTWDKNAAIKCELFVNGASIASRGDVTTWDTSTATSFMIASSAYNANCRIGRVEIYDKVLTAAQLFDTYQHRIARTDMSIEYVINGDSPEVDTKDSGPDMTVNGSPAVANDPFFVPTAYVSQVVLEIMAEPYPEGGVPFWPVIMRLIDQQSR